ncbi:hypothetical protein CYMTET_27635, partial [Cymbomonas tetramitiformis]
WPATLDVLMRAELSHVLSHVYKSASQDKRTIRRIVPSGGAENHKAFMKFIEYLGQRSRAGVVKIGENGQKHTKTIYLIPPSASVCAALGVDRDLRECIIALICYQ